MDNEAIKPTFFNSLPTIVREQQAKQKGVSEEEQSLHALSQQRGWVILREYIDSLLKDMDNSTSAAMSKGLSFEEIGKNAVVIDLTKGLIKRVLDKVEDAREQVEK